MKEDLKYGETPWNNLSREELLLEVWRMASALSAARSVMSLSRHAMGATPFWNPRGSGCRALKMTDEALVKYDAAGEEQCYRAFFRYAADLLFSFPGFDDWWMICPECGLMRAGEHVLAGLPCSQDGCDGTMRKITWDDMKPNGASAPAAEMVSP